jgi:DUF1365 family protein
MAIESALLKGIIFHKRLRPRINQFVYRAYYLCFDLSKLSALASKIFSVNKFNLFSFHARDHGLRDGSDLQNWIKEIFAAENINAAEIILLTHPRILGYVFNPVSFWFALNDKKELIAVLAEVNNTFGDSHNYLIFNQDHRAISANQWLEATKSLYVSPFMKVEGKYKFRFIYGEKKIAVWIDYFDPENNLMLQTAISGKREAMSNVNLLKYFCLMPFVTFKVIILIHYQAIKLWLKKITFVSRPNPPVTKLTKSDQ